MFYKHVGLTLLEILVTLTIIIVLLSLALTSYGEVISAHRPEFALKKLKRALHLAKTQAASSGNKTTLCHLENQQCIDNAWHKKLTVFVDRGELRVLDGDDIRLHELSAIAPQDTIEYPRRAIIFNSDASIKGFTNGTFVYCLPIHQGVSDGLEMSVSNSGRARIRDTKKCPL
ncbi:hypothetical protein PSECIP111854_03548 [Pseudoalteromonas sp. CIP111854]|uniref:Type II secretion system protein H n=1 Tax=Pseudoalteromonas holothuriae TaxID=2963714 RepID=A0A9W4W2M0_9GAMM|nr:GspH/FimT family pseudopilin [Pseudoalteromonas sp. CIP111854]CAH9064829.1 hypothetical protein PSECIP111854_03548 [Pseudoalteromonas sp. CIP111854]